MRFSANLGFLWTDRSLPDAIAAAEAAGFDAVECHMPYAFDPAIVRAALDEAGLSMISLNTRLGSEPNDFGLAAQPGRAMEARMLIDEAVSYAAAIGCGHVSVLAGRSDRGNPAECAYRDNVAFAAERSAEHGITILLEPINHRSVPGYHLSRLADGVSTIEAIGASNVKLMVDCFHTQITEGDLSERIGAVMAHVGHIQFAAVPDRAEPDHGEVDYRWLLPALVDRGYRGAFGAEYSPATSVEAGLGWLAGFAARP